MEVTDARHLRLVEWLVSDPRERGTMQALAEEIGVSPRTLRDWKERPEVRALWEKRAVEVGGDPERLQRVMDSMFEAATDPNAKDRVAAARAWADLSGAIKPPPKGEQLTKDGLGGVSDEDLEKLIAEYAAREAAERKK